RRQAIITARREPDLAHRAFVRGVTGIGGGDAAEGGHREHQTCSHGDRLHRNLNLERVGFSLLVKKALVQAKPGSRRQSVSAARTIPAAPPSAGLWSGAAPSRDPRASVVPTSKIAPMHGE